LRGLSVASWPAIQSANNFKLESVPPNGTVTGYSFVNFNTKGLFDEKDCTGSTRKESQAAALQV
jgi:hypothetical protein